LVVHVIAAVDDVRPTTKTFDITGAGGEIVKATGGLVPLAVVTVTLVSPGAALAAMEKVAVICVLLVTLMLLTVIPDAAPTVAPLPNGAGQGNRHAGAGHARIRTQAAQRRRGRVDREGCRGTGPPAGCHSCVSGPKVALATMEKVAVICVLPSTATLLTVISGLVATVAPETKLVPVSVTGILEPGAPALGPIPVSVGAGGLIMKGTGALVPPEVVTVTLVAPSVALPAIVNVAVICVPLITLMLLTVMPAPAPTVAPLTKLDPVKVTGTLVSCI
jgi:hypothetical protein